MAAEAGHTLLPYREDHIGVTKRPLAIAVGLTILTIALTVPAVRTGSQAIGALTVTAFVFAFCAAGIALVLVYTGWVLAIEIDPEQIRFGALRKADARARRGLPPSTTPYATWLHEYRCNVQAVRRVWIVRGARDALNPERATGVPILQRIGGRMVAHEGWIRIPFSPGGLMLQLDSAFAAAPPTDQKMWTGFYARVPVSSMFGESDILYTPISNPDKCRAALVEALRVNGLELDAEGSVHQIPGAVVPPRQTIKAPPANAPARRRHGRLTTVLSILWALIPLVTLGYFTWIPYVYAALRVRQLHTTLLTLLVIGLEAVYWWLTAVVGSQTGPNPQGGGVFAGMLALLAIGGTVSCFILRRSVFYVY
jgi:hypothetical protein